MKAMRLFTLFAFYIIILLSCVRENPEPVEIVELFNPIDLTIGSYSGNARSIWSYFDISDGSSETGDTTFQTTHSIEYNEDSSRIILFDEFDVLINEFEVENARINEENIEFIRSSSLSSGSALLYFIANDSIWYSSGWDGLYNNWASYNFRGKKSG